jgi:hypothetical protein
MGGAGEVAQHHAEGVVEGNQVTDAVVIGVAIPFADEEAIVQNVVVGQRGAFGKSGGARGVLDVDRIIEGQIGCSLELRQFMADLVGGEAAIAGLGGGHREEHARLRLIQGVRQLIVR